jgi:acetolactate synthase-1/2/3 large subunit
VVGDGGFAHVWSELETAVRMKTPLTLTVLNNGVLGYQKDAEDVKFGRHTSACRFSPVDHAKIAEACGCRGIRVESAADYLPALKEAIASGQPTVLDVATDSDAYPPITFFDEKLDNVRARRQRESV